MSAPAWHADPTGRHEHRWWDGWRWTDHVADNGVLGHDPLAVAAPPHPPPPGAPPTPDLVALARRRTSGSAVAALTCGIVGLTFVPLIPSIVAIALAVAARRDLAADPDLEGRGMATAGLVTGIVGTAICAAVILVLIVVAVT